MKRILFIFISILSISCSETDDSFSNSCSSDCTTVHGRIVDGNGVGIAGATVEFYFENNPLYASFKRILANGSTDATGNYELNGFIENDELGNVENGSFRVRLIEESLTDAYMKNTMLEGVEVGYYTGMNSNIEKYLPQISTRDTLIEYNLSIPKKVPLTIKIRGFQPSGETDSIDVSILMKKTSSQMEVNYSVSNFIRSDYPLENFDISTFGGLNFINEINVQKRKNGVIENDSFEILITEENNNEVTIFY